MESNVNHYLDRLYEIELALNNNDLNRVSRRLLDLTHDFKCDPQLIENSLLFREQYNLNKELGQSGNNNNQLEEHFLNLIKQLKSCSPEPITENESEIICLAKNIEKAYNTFHLQQINLKLERGKIIGLVGENGNGKTTLLRLLCGELSSSGGTIEFFAGNKQLTTWEEIKKEVAFIPQRINRWWGNVEEQVSFAAALKGYKGIKNKEAVRFIIHRLGLTRFKNHSWSELSSGYKLRVEIAKTLVWNPRVLMLDEPLANLDLLAQELLLQDIKDLAYSAKNPVSVILSSQQLHEVETIADQIVFLKNGRAVFNGAIHELNAQEDYFTLEIDGNFSYAELSVLLEDFKVRIEKNATGFTIYLPKDFKVNDLLSKITNANLELKYFRNITSSTKKLFNDKY